MRGLVFARRDWSFRGFPHESVRQVYGYFPRVAGSVVRLALARDLDCLALPARPAGHPIHRASACKTLRYGALTTPVLAAPTRCEVPELDLLAVAGGNSSTGTTIFRTRFSSGRMRSNPNSSHSFWQLIVYADQRDAPRRNSGQS